MKCISLWAALIVGSAARTIEKRSQNIPIGYRVVDETVANKYLGWGNKIVWEDYSQAIYQLGKGIYLTPEFAGYPAINLQTDYDCVVLADQTAWNNVNKVVVPEMTNDQCPKPLWWGTGVSNRASYVQAESGGDVSTTVLISDIEFFFNAPPQPVTQFLIPPQLLTSGTLTLYVQCAQKGTNAHNALGAAYGPYGYNPIDWQDWQNLHFAQASG